MVRAARSRRMPAKVKAAVAVAVLILPAMWLVDTVQRVSLQGKLSPIASEIAGRQVGVRCPGWWGRLLSPGDTNAGVVAIDEDGRMAGHTDLRTATCDELAAVIGGGREQQLACVSRSTSCGDDAQATAWAVNTLAHEAVHLRGIQDEAVTECHAVQNLAVAAERLGATPEQARGLALLHLETSPAKKPVQYQLPGGCENGGPLDERPADPAWP
jgi:hypothetical protein